MTDRVQFLISPDDAESLKALVRQSRSGTISEVIRNALSWYAWSLAQVQKGSEIQVVDSRGLVRGVVFSGFGGYTYGDGGARTP
jgi:hypothetical protein